MLWGEMAQKRPALLRAGYSAANATDSGGDVESEPEALSGPSARGVHGAGADDQEERCGRVRRVLPCGLVALSVAAVALTAAYFTVPWGRAWATRGATLHGLGGEEFSVKQEGPRCGDILQDYDFPGNDIASHDNVDSADRCCQMCIGNGDCEAWAWGEQRDKVFSDVCYLKGGIPFEMMKGRAHHGWAAGSVIRPLVTIMDIPAPAIVPLRAAESSRSLSSPRSQGDSQMGMLGSIRELLAGLFHPQPQASNAAPALATVPAYAASPTTAPDFGTTMAPLCGLTEDGMDYPGNDLERVEDIGEAESCCQECAKNEECVAWSWQKPQSMCFLKGAHPRDEITKIPNEDFTSGMPTQVGRSIEATERPAGQSLYCFVLMVPDTYEADLLDMQFDKGISLFACDEYAVFTNQDLKIGGEVEAIRVDSDLKCRSGGEFQTALNTDIFLTVWNKLLKLDRYSHHDWTVKVDADCAFSPARLRAIVETHHESDTGVYLNNCQLGMHGPLEVLSRNAVRAFAGGRAACAEQLVAKCGGQCQWGEDMYLDQCLQLLHIRREYEQHLLLEDHCEPPLGWDSCSSPGVAAFHPFKDIDDYEECISRMVA